MRSRIADLRVGAGKTHGRNFYLFTYRNFSRTDLADIDPVVVGLTFAPADVKDKRQVVIDADISGESTGDCVESLAPRVVSSKREDLLRATHEIARELSGRSGPIIEALFDASRRRIP